MMTGTRGWPSVDYLTYNFTVIYLKQPDGVGGYFLLFNIQWNPTPEPNLEDRGSQEEMGREKEEDGFFHI